MLSTVVFFLHVIIKISNFYLLFILYFAECLKMACDSRTMCTTQSMMHVLVTEKHTLYAYLSMHANLSKLYISYIWKSM
jgi:hypothetical protein